MTVPLWVAGCGGGDPQDQASDPNPVIPSPVEPSPVDPAPDVPDPAGALRLDEEASNLVSGGLFFIAADDAVASATQIDAVIDGSVPVKLVAGGGILSGVFPVVPDGQHFISFNFSGEQQIIFFDLASPAQPADPGAFIEQRLLEAVAELGLAVEQRNELLSFLSSLSSPELSQLAATILAMETEFSATSLVAKNLSGPCQQALTNHAVVLRRTGKAIAAAGISMLLPPPGGVIAVVISGAAFIKLRADVGEAFDEIANTCFDFSYVLDGLNSARSSGMGAELPFAKMEAGGRLEFRSGESAMLRLRGSADLNPAAQELVSPIVSFVQTVFDALDVVSGVLPAPLESSIRAFLSEIDAFGRTSADALADVSFEVIDISDGVTLDVFNQESDTIFVTFNLSDSEVGAGESVPFSFKIVPNNGNALEPIIVDASLVVNDEPPQSVLVGTIVTYENGTRGTRLPLLSGGSDIRLANNDSLIGDVSFDEQNRRLIYTAASDFVGFDVVSLTVTVDNEPVSARVEVFVLESCEVVFRDFGLVETCRENPDVDTLDFRRSTLTNRGRFGCPSVEVFRSVDTYEDDEFTDRIYKRDLASVAIVARPFGNCANSPGGLHLKSSQDSLAAVSGGGVGIRNVFGEYVDNSPGYDLISGVFLFSEPVVGNAPPGEFFNARQGYLRIFEFNEGQDREIFDVLDTYSHIVPPDQSFSGTAGVRFEGFILNGERTDTGQVLLTSPQVQAALADIAAQTRALNDLDAEAELNRLMPLLPSAP